MYMCVLTNCYLYTTSIIIVSICLPLYIFQLSILHIPNSILPNNIPTGLHAVQLRRSNYK